MCVDILCRLANVLVGHRTQYRLYQQQKETGAKVVAMNDERIRQLEEMGFVWALRTGPDSAWRKKIGELENFRSHHGHCAVPAEYRGNVRLGQWAASVREGYRAKREGKPNALEDDKVAELDTLGFAWEEPPPDLAEATNNEVTTVVTEVPDDEDEDEKPDDSSDVAIDYVVEGQPLPHASVDGPMVEPTRTDEVVDEVATDHILQAAIEHAEI